jgi:DNA replication protein DnaC
VQAFKRELAMIKANIPPKYKDLEFKDFKEQNQTFYTVIQDYCNNLARARRRGIGLYLVGGHGTGKTLLACCVLKEALRQGYTGWFGFLSSIIVAINNEFFKRANTTVYQTIKHVDFLVIDEVEKVYKSDSGYVDALFDELVRGRDFANKPVIVTSNCTMDALEGVHGKSIVSMLTEKLIVVPIVGPDYRKEIAKGLKGDLKGGY